MTAQRRVVAEVLDGEHVHLTADEVHARAVAKLPEISRATVYNTLGELVSYLLFVGIMAAPVIQIAGIGTQISEAFAGLDRIREIRSMKTEADDDVGREPLGEIRGDVTFENVTFEYTPGVPVRRSAWSRWPRGSESR